MRGNFGQRADAEQKFPKARRSLGQNFLRDANIARKMAGLLRITPEDSVLEIGPGSGALTRFILKQNPALLVLVEKDPYWAGERMRDGAGRLQVVLADALLLPWDRFTLPWKFIGNLPYNIASPLLWEICSRASGLDLAVFMVQKEAGLRMTAKPGTSAYGALSVWLQSFARIKAEFTVPPQVFAPKPKVESMVLSFCPAKPEDSLSGRRNFDPAALSRALRICFQARRKQLGVILRGLGAGTDVLEDLGIDPRTRPERLIPEDFQRLSARPPFRDPPGLPLCPCRRETPDVCRGARKNSDAP
ncbi:MAG: 16S rRNA (adenine(1518)-N(6)/adenine(1519)-N(6))-dimethyltransferase RsmA [Desulfovibrio sp.]|jgi:16S rRNA (adenine1518-N6/adenine1519-N6)-dimethyltransferase|nr:16S rRNA (adenine(1518)-N(6)/adenine(1519)-N(6))-dimethyltransferase RsmA [Desulfovibrio sp.]